MASASQPERSTPEAMYPDELIRAVGHVVMASAWVEDETGPAGDAFIAQHGHCGLASRAGMGCLGAGPRGQASGELSTIEDLVDNEISVAQLRVVGR